MDDELQLAQVYGQQPEQPQPAQQPLPQQPLPQQRPEEPFTQADQLRLYQFNQGLSETDRQVDQGILSAEQGEALKAQIVQRRQPLLARKDQAQVQGMQHQARMAMQQHALAESMEQQGAHYRARNRENMITRYVDPVTGDVTHLIESARGRIEELGFDHAAGHHERRAEKEAGIQESIDNLQMAEEPELASIGEPSQPLRTSRGTALEGPEWEEHKRRLANLPWLPAPGFSMTPAQQYIDWHHRQGKPHGRQDVYDMALRDAEAQKAGLDRDPAPSPQEMRSMWQQASAAVGLPPGRERDHAVATIYGSLLRDRTTLNHLNARQRGQMVLNKQQQTARTELKQTPGAGREAQKKRLTEAGITPEKEIGIRRAVESDLRKEYQAALDPKKGLPEDQRPEWMQNEGLRRAEAQDRFEQLLSPYRRDPEAGRQFEDLRDKLGTDKKGNIDISSANQAQMEMLKVMAAEPGHHGLTSRQAKNLRETIDQVQKLPPSHVASPQNQATPEQVQADAQEMIQMPQRTNQEAVGQFKELVGQIGRDSQGIGLDLGAADLGQLRGLRNMLLQPNRHGILTRVATKTLAEVEKAIEARRKGTPASGALPTPPEPTPTPATTPRLVQPQGPVGPADAFRYGQGGGVR